MFFPFLRLFSNNKYDKKKRDFNNKYDKKKRDFNNKYDKKKREKQGEKGNCEKDARKFTVLTAG